ncbi:MAG: hypothetical protein IJ682_07690 [Lachnospiraceae bacterium]|nr:hypothetical protein [Lachnospiraceae bacterium]
MKAIVLGVKNGRAALLLEDGTTTYCRMECRPGQRVEVPDQDNVAGFVPRTVRTAAAAAALALVVSGGTLYATALPVSFVTEDVNPSMEYSLNRMDRVLGVSALNDDAKTIVEDLDVEGTTIQTAVGAAGKRMEEAGTLDEDGYVLFSVTSDSDQRAQRLENELSDMMGGQDEDDSNFSVLRVSREEHRAARKLDMSAGRYKEMLNAKGKAAASDEKMVSEFQSKPVREMLGGSSDETKEDAVQSANESGLEKQNTKETKKAGENADNDSSDVKNVSEKEQKVSTPKQTRPAPSPAVPQQQHTANPPIGNPSAPQSEPSQPQPDNGNADSAPANADAQPAETPQEVKKEEKNNKSDKAEPKKETGNTDKADKEKEIELPADDFDADDGPGGGGEPPGGGEGPGGQP